jgi:hypothetical protein
VGLQRGSFLGRPTWDRLWQNVSRLSSLFEVAFDGGHGNGEGLGHLRLAVAGIDGFEHPLA